MKDGTKGIGIKERGKHTGFDRCFSAVHGTEKTDAEEYIWIIRKKIIEYVHCPEMSFVLFFTLLADGLLSDTLSR